MKHLNDSKTFIDYSQYMDNVYNNIDDYNPSRKTKILIVFDNMIAEIMSNKQFLAMVKELFVRCRKLNISLAFITRFYFSVTKEVTLNSTHYLIIMKIHNKIKLQNIATNHLADIFYYKDFMNIYLKCTSEPYCFLTIDITLPASNPLRFRKCLLLPCKNDTD